MFTTTTINLASTCEHKYVSQNGAVFCEKCGHVTLTPTTYPTPYTTPLPQPYFGDYPPFTPPVIICGNTCVAGTYCF